MDARTDAVCARHRALAVAPRGRIARARIATVRFIDRRLGIIPGAKRTAKPEQPDVCPECTREAARRHHLTTFGIIAGIWVGIIALTVLTSPRSFERAIWGAVVPSLIVAAVFAVALLIWRAAHRKDSWIHTRSWIPGRRSRDDNPTDG